MYYNPDYYLDYFHFGEQKGESITKNSLDNVRSDISMRSAASVTRLELSTTSAPTAGRRWIRSRTAIVCPNKKRRCN